MERRSLLGATAGALVLGGLAQVPAEAAPAAGAGGLVTTFNVISDIQGDLTPAVQRSAGPVEAVGRGPLGHRPRGGARADRALFARPPRGHVRGGLSRTRSAQAVPVTAS
ncbi:hypothetical protein [Streptomyces nodosus]|uniref:hypothetical protein n=1 Tax=Streptomyces nodosus TaxID=40318 RepID=UPI0036E49F67